MSIKIGKRIEVDESNFKSLKTLNTIDEEDRVCICNDSDDIEIDEKAFYDYLESVEGADRVKSLKIEWSSKLKNVKVIKAFPNLQSLHVSGQNIMTLEGLEWYKGKFIGIDTDKNQKLNIEKIAQIPITRMYLNYGQKADFESIGKCLSLTRLELYESPSPVFFKWRNVPLEHLRFTQGRFSELIDIGHIKTLSNLSVAGCRKFERFSGDNTNVRILSVLGCRRFDTNSLVMLQELEYVTVDECAREIELSDLPEHPTIRGLGLYECKVNADLDDIKKKMPKLEKIVTDKITKEFI